MAKYIDAEALKKSLCEWCNKEYENQPCEPDECPLRTMIIDAPTPDVAEVKHGKWYRHDKKKHGDSCYHCSECERMPLTDCGMVWELTPYCPFCGAKMDKGGADNDGNKE